MRAAIYIRVSTEEQVKEGYSISAQKQKLQAFCASQDWEIAGFYADEGISAKDTNRPELQKMLSDIKKGKIECVLVYRLDRLTRSVFDLYKLLDVFDKHNCKFKSATEVYDTTTAMGRMFITIVAALAQWERENMAERIRFGQDEKARQGKYVHQVALFGYSLDKKEWKLHIKEDEARIVRLIYDMYLKGYGMGKLSGYLNQKQLLTRAGNTWTNITIAKILKHPSYKGAISWNGIVVENAHEGIVTKEEWDNIQQLIKIRAGLKPRAVGSRSIFSSLIRCKSCGKTMSGTYTTYKNNKGESTRYHYYRCREYTHRTCDNRSRIDEKKLEAAFLDFICNNDFSNLIKQAATETASTLSNTKPTIDAEQLTKELNLIQKRKKKFQFAWADDAIEYEDFKARMEELKEKEDQINIELNSVTPTEKEDQINIKEIEVALKSVRDNWQALDRKEKKNLVQTIIKEIHCRREGEGRGYKVIIDRIDFN